MPDPPEQPGGPLPPALQPLPDDELSLYDPAERPEALRRGLLADGDPERSGSVCAVRTGRRLARIEAERLYEGWGRGGLRELIEEASRAGQLSYGWEQAQKYLRLTELPLGPLVGTHFSVQKLRQLAIRKDRGEDVLALIALLRQGRALPGTRPGRCREQDRPSVIGAELSRVLCRAAALLGRLAEKVGDRGGAEGHGWEQTLDERMRSLVLGYAALQGRPFVDLWTERRRTGRGPEGEEAGGEKPAGLTGEKASEGADLPPFSGGETGAEEDWYVPLVRAILGVLAEEERRVLEERLLLVLAGGPPAPLCAFLRGLGERLAGAPAAMREDLSLWLQNAAAPDLGARWPYVYNFFVTAQLPGFRFHLHCLRAVRLPPVLREALAAAWAHFPLVEADAGAAEGAEAPGLPPALGEAERRLRSLLEGGAEASAEALSWVWGEAVDLRRELADALRGPPAG